MRFLILALFFSFQILAHSGSFGVRLGGGGAFYAGGVDNTANRTAADNARRSITINGKTEQTVADYTKYFSAGWLVPLQLEATYGLTEAFEVLLGARTDFSGSIIGDDKYFMEKFGVSLGYRYYFNTKDPVQAYMSSQIGCELTKYLRLEGKSAFGFLFEITPMVGIFTEGNLMLAGLYNSKDDIGKGAQLAAGFSTGLHLHF